MDRLSSVLLAKNSFFKHIIVSKHQIISLVKGYDPLKSYYNFSHSNILALKNPLMFFSFLNRISYLRPYDLWAS